jgi:hypothetical protein
VALLTRLAAPLPYTEAILLPIRCPEVWPIALYLKGGCCRIVLSERRQSVTRVHIHPQVSRKKAIELNGLSSSSSLLLSSLELSDTQVYEP